MSARDDGMNGNYQSTIVMPSRACTNGNHWHCHIGQWYFVDVPDCSCPCHQDANIRTCVCVEDHQRLVVDRDHARALAGDQ